MKRAFSLVEVIVASSLALLVIIFLFSFIIYINKMNFFLSKKFSIANGSKILINYIANEVLKASPPSPGVNPIISVDSKKIVLYNVEIDNLASKRIYTVELSLSSNSVNNGTSYTVNKIVREGSAIVKNENKKVFIEASSNLYFQNVDYIAIRINIYNSFTFRNKTEHINYSFDAFVNK